VIDGNKASLIRLAKRSLADARAAVSAPRVVWVGIDESEETFAARIAVIRQRHTGRLLCPMHVGFACPDGCEPVWFILKLFRALHPDAPKRNRVVSGGRGSGKSHGIATAVILRVLDRKLRVLACREIMRSLRESVHHLLSEKISEMNLDAFFEINDREIRCLTTGSEILFQGLFAHVSSLKSLEDIGLVWCEESENVSARSVEVLSPTIRAKDSELWFSLNPDDEHATVMDFINGTRSDVSHVHVTYADNSFFPAVLEQERAYLQRVDHATYMHVWEGHCRQHSDAQVFYGKYIVETFTPGADWSGPYLGADWGYSQDPTTLVRAWIFERTLHIEHEAYAIGCDIDRTPTLFDAVPEARLHTIRADSARPETISFMQRNGYPNMQPVAKWTGSVEDGIAHIRSYEKIVIHPRCTHAIDEFRLYSFKVDRLSGDIQPVAVDRHNHVIDALRYALQPMIKGAGQGILGWYAAQNVANTDAAKAFDDGAQPLPRNRISHFRNPTLKIESIR